VEVVYGNYVIKTCIDLSERRHFGEFVKLTEIYNCHRCVFQQWHSQTYYFWWFCRCPTLKLLLPPVDNHAFCSLAKEKVTTSWPTIVTIYHDEHGFVLSLSIIAC